VPVNKFHVGMGAMLPFIADPDDDLHPFLRERFLKLPVAAGKTGERAGAEALETPENHHLESGVKHQRIGKPAAAQRLSQPGGRCRRPLDQGGNPFGRTAVDQFDAMQVRSVEKPLPVVDPAVVRFVVLCRNLLDGADPFGEPGSEHNLCLGMEQHSGVTIHSGQLYRHQIKGVPFFRPSCHDFETAASFLLEDHPFADTQVVEAVKAQSGIAVERAVRQPLGDDSHRQHRLAVKDMGAEKRIVVQIEGDGKRFGQIF